MIKNKKAIALPLITVIGLLVALLLIAVTVAALTGGSVLGGKDKSNIVCRVNLDADVFTNVDIEKATCENKGECSLFGGGNPLGVFTFDREGTVFLQGTDGKNYDKKPYHIEFIVGGEQDVVLSGCLPSNIADKVTIKAISKSDKIQDTKLVEVN